MDELVENLQVYLSTKIINKNKKRPQLGIIRLLCLVSGHIVNNKNGEMLLNMIVPMVEWKVIDKINKKKSSSDMNKARQDEFIYKIFLILRNLTKHSYQNNQAILYIVMTLFVNLDKREIRSLLIGCIKNLYHNMHSQNLKGVEYMENTNVYEKQI